jgi:hypothetical protein
MGNICEESGEVHHRGVATSSPDIKVVLVNDGDDVETPWAVDLGPADGAPKGSRRVRLNNVPFLHAKPTWGDIIVVTPNADGRLEWNGNGASYSDVENLIEEDGGRYTVIVDYMPHAGTSADAAWRALVRVFERENTNLADADAVCEGTCAPSAKSC